MMRNSGPSAITIVTGYLGAGKTTLLNHILSGDHGRRIAVIVNEFGEIPIDHDLVMNVEDNVYTMANGCICCTVRDDLVEVLDELLGAREPFDHIVVETTGLAEPGGIIMTFLTHPESGESFTVDGVITVADALHLPAQLGRSPEASHQLAYADLILLNKSDLASAAELERVEGGIRGYNPLATIHRTTHARLDPDAVLDIGGFDPLRFSIKQAEAREGEHHTAHEAGVVSVSLRLPGDIDLERFESWTGELIGRQHEDIYRMKGIISLAGQPRRYIFHGVHALSNWQYGDPWGDNPRESRMVIIGKNLDRKALEESFRKMASESA